MRIPRPAVAALMAAAATSTSAFSITTGGRSFVGRAAMSKVSRFPSVVTKSLKRGSTGMNMFFGNLFGGGAVEAKIDYDSLEHPGPELGAAASAGKTLVNSERDPHLQAATFAAGCFWGAQLLFERIPGVEYTAVGYTQGPEDSPTYGQVCGGTTGHTEGVIVYYDPKECDYNALLEAFFGFIDPTTVNGQGNDFGKQYRTGVYFHTPEQEKAAKSFMEQEQTKYRRPIATELKAASPFWPAEKYHQHYLEKGGRFGTSQSAEKGCTDKIRCYG